MRAAGLAAALTVVLAAGASQADTARGIKAFEGGFYGVAREEFEKSAAEGDKVASRVTIGGAGGGLASNKRRWVGQFSQPDRSSTADKVREEKKEISGCTVHLFDISGTYNAPPFEPGGGGRSCAGASCRPS